MSSAYKVHHLWGLVAYYYKIGWKNQNICNIFNSNSVITIYGSITDSQETNSKMVLISGVYYRLLFLAIYVIFDII